MIGYNLYKVSKIFTFIACLVFLFYNFFVRPIKSNIIIMTLSKSSLAYFKIFEYLYGFFFFFFLLSAAVV